MAVDNDNQYKRNLKRKKQIAQKEKTDREIARLLSEEGAPMEEIRPGAGLTGGWANDNEKFRQPKAINQPSNNLGKMALNQSDQENLPSPDNSATQYQRATPEVQKAMHDKGLAPTDQPSTTSTPVTPPDEPEETNKSPLTRRQATQQKIDDKKQDVAKKQERVDKTQEQYDQAKQGGRQFNQIMQAARLSSQKRDLARSKQQLAALENVAGIQTLTSGLLRNSWFHLIDSWGLTALYIAFHGVMAYFTPFSNFFCKFGEEWRFVQAIKKRSKTAGERLAETFAIPEGAGCCGIFGLVGLGCFILFTLFAFIAWIATAGPTTWVGVILEAVWNTILKAIKDLLPI